MTKSQGHLKSQFQSFPSVHPTFENVLRIFALDSDLHLVRYWTDDTNRGFHIFKFVAFLLLWEQLYWPIMWIYKRNLTLFPLELNSFKVFYIFLHITYESEQPWVKGVKYFHFLSALTSIETLWTICAAKWNDDMKNFKYMSELSVQAWSEGPKSALSPTFFCSSGCDTNLVALQITYAGCHPPWIDAPSKVTDHWDEWPLLIRPHKTCFAGIWHLAGGDLRLCMPAL